MNNLPFTALRGLERSGIIPMDPSTETYIRKIRRRRGLDNCPQRLNPSLSFEQTADGIVSVQDGIFVV